MRKLVSPMVASGVALTLVYAGPAAAVAASDFDGKTICWTNSFGSETTSTFGPGRHFEDSMAGVGSWSMTPRGMHVHTDRYDYFANVRKLPDGRFSSTLTVMGMAVTSTGRYCE